MVFASSRWRAAIQRRRRKLAPGFPRHCLLRRCLRQDVPSSDCDREPTPPTHSCICALSSGSTSVYGCPDQITHGLNGGIHANRQSFGRDSSGYRHRGGGYYHGAVRRPDHHRCTSRSSRPPARPGYGTQAVLSRSRHRNQASGGASNGLLPQPDPWHGPHEELHLVPEWSGFAVHSRPHAVPELSGFAGLLPIAVRGLRGVDKGRAPM